MKVKTINYAFKQGFVGLWRNRTMSAASIGSVAASLVVLGVIIILVLNINNLAYLAGKQFDTIEVYLQDNLPSEEIVNLERQISSLQGVKTTEYVSREEALRKMKEDWGEQGYLLENLESNPLPNSFVIYLNEIEMADGVVVKLKKLHGIEEVKYYKAIIEKLLGLAKFVRKIGLSLIVLLTLIAMFIISNTIKLSLNARRQEINIMKYVGATNWFIRWPFIIEGMMLGLIGTAIALTCIYFGYSYIFNLITARFYVLISAYLLTAEELMTKALITFAVLGSGVGALGSIVSLRKYLRV